MKEVERNKLGLETNQVSSGEQQDLHSQVTMNIPRD